MSNENPVLPSADGQETQTTSNEQLFGGTRLRGMAKTSEPKRPLITIITATYNAAGCLPNLAKSIREQTYDNVEWIVVDGASSDGTLEVIRQNEDVIDYWISEPDTGIYDAWNKGLNLARGEWICFLGADDFFWGAEVLETMVPVLVVAYPRSRVVFGSLAVVNHGGGVLYTLGESWEAVRHRFLSVMCLPHPGLMHHQSLFRTHGVFDSSYRIAGDYELLLRELRTGEAWYLEGLIIAGMTLGGTSTTPASSWMMLHEMRRAARENEQTLPGAAWLIAVARHALRRLIWGVFGEQLARMMLDMGRWLSGKPAHWTKS